jgi:hypothetical protein
MHRAVVTALWPAGESNVLTEQSAASSGVDAKLMALAVDAQRDRDTPVFGRLHLRPPSRLPSWCSLSPVRTPQ